MAQTGQLYFATTRLDLHTHVYDATLQCKSLQNQFTATNTF